MQRRSSATTATCPTLPFASNCMGIAIPKTLTFLPFFFFWNPSEVGNWLCLVPITACVLSATKLRVGEAELCSTGECLVKLLKWGHTPNTKEPAARNRRGWGAESDFRPPLALNKACLRVNFFENNRAPGYHPHTVRHSWESLATGLSLDGF